MQAHAATSDATEIVVIVFHRSWNQPLMSHPSRFAAAAITTTISAKFSSRRQRGRGRFVEAGASWAVAVTPFACSDGLRADRRYHGADEPENRDEDPDDEHDPVPLAQAAEAEHEQKHEVEKDSEATDAPPHTEFSFRRRRCPGRR
jgi:hypothetical protein